MQLILTGGRIQPTIGAGLGRERASWRYLEMVAKATLPLKVRQRVVHLENIGLDG
jgi:hypothetical protein